VCTVCTFWKQELLSWPDIYLARKFDDPNIWLRPPITEDGLMKSFSPKISLWLILIKMVSPIRLTTFNTMLILYNYWGWSLHYLYRYRGTPKGNSRSRLIEKSNNQVLILAHAMSFGDLLMYTKRADWRRLQAGLCFANKGVIGGISPQRPLCTRAKLKPRQIDEL